MTSNYPLFGDIQKNLAMEFLDRGSGTWVVFMNKTRQRAEEYVGKMERRDRNVAKRI